LDRKGPEFKLIQRYVKNGITTNQKSSSKNDNFIKNVFSVERKKEPQRIEKWNSLPNRLILWHGTKTGNVVSILAHGLLPAPSFAPSTGYMFGKGIYFADMFEKSWAYTAGFDFNNNEFRYMLLCEVACGEFY
jgi:poly [ADP-ribose] polymerase